MSAMIPHRAASLYEIDRGMRLQAELDVDALLARVSQPEPANFCSTHDDVPAPVSPWVFWPVVVTFSLVLTFAAYELATRVLPAVLPIIWSWK